MRISVVTLGCKVNQCESAALTEAFAARGHTSVGPDEPADVCVVNTCTVTGRTDYQSRQSIRKVVREHPDATVIVTGCYAQTRPDAIADIPGVSLIVGTEDKERIPDLVAEPLPERPRRIVGDPAGIRTCSAPPLDRFSGHTRAFLKIQDGCNAFCSYCIVPYARGRSRSLPEEDVLERLRRLGRNGYREVVLTGIHLGAYGQDLEPPTDLARLLRRAETAAPVERLRLSSLEPLEAEGVAETIRAGRRICPHLHIPLQSGDDGVLAAMNRHYDSAFFAGLIRRLVDAIPDLGVGVDVLAGFPGESENAFLRTVALLEALPVAYLHVFPYSRRPGTAAADLPGQVPEAEKKNRCETLRALSQRKRQAFAERFVGRTLSVLIEDKRDPATGLKRGFSENYIPVLVEGGPGAAARRIVPVRTERASAGRLFGRVAP
ncbi:MAG TPA: tRNA (N(6)-L-threonylcarbamoyladenosine(37)-C(2))-methylthiotransferase MtaB [Syntrophus sp. (in: bacteria)]|jgi:threonylcarbamoyladenosine tRNA methylthiotransferase MtaB|nr:tRNA (N(6)-L-threonylcarbamoyladenosine(37)-C(2))-methylthiotransferase MtaB [Syntrophus sp. (in: bacteria)]